MSDPVGAPRSRAALTLMWPLLAAAAALAVYLAVVHVRLTHGAGAFESGCNLDATFDCDRVNTSTCSLLTGQSGYRTRTRTLMLMMDSGKPTASLWLAREE